MIRHPYLTARLGSLQVVMTTYEYNFCMNCLIYIPAYRRYQLCNVNAVHAVKPAPLSLMLLYWQDYPQQMHRSVI